MKLLSLFIFAVWAISTVSCKRYYIYKDHKVNWYGAFQRCLNHNLQLATINSAREQADLEREISKENVDLSEASQWLWTSGTDQAEKGKFFWMSSGDSFSYTKWGISQPDNIDESCVLIRKESDDISWDDENCMKQLNYVCEKRSKCIKS